MPEYLAERIEEWQAGLLIASPWILMAIVLPLLVVWTALLQEPEEEAKAQRKASLNAIGLFLSWVIFLLLWVVFFIGGTTTGALVLWGNAQLGADVCRESTVAESIGICFVEHGRKQVVAPDRQRDERGPVQVREQVIDDNTPTREFEEVGLWTAKNLSVSVYSAEIIASSNERVCLTVDAATVAHDEESGSPLTGRIRTIVKWDDLETPFSVDVELVELSGEWHVTQIYYGRRCRIPGDERMHRAFVRAVEPVGVSDLGHLPRGRP